MLVSAVHLADTLVTFVGVYGCSPLDIFSDKGRTYTPAVRSNIISLTTSKSFEPSIVLTNSVL